MVKYLKDGSIHAAPTVTRPVKAKAHMSPPDIMLVSALLNMRYSGPLKRELPPGARHAIKPGGTFTDETRLFITDFQHSSSQLHADGNISPLPIGRTDDELFKYTIFNLYNDVRALSAFQGDIDAENTVLNALKSLPHLHNLDAMVLDLPSISPESAGAGGLGIESFPGSP
jgi:hypothetical protein